METAVAGRSSSSASSCSSSSSSTIWKVAGWLFAAVSSRANTVPELPFPVQHAALSPCALSPECWTPLAGVIWSELGQEFPQQQTPLALGLPGSGGSGGGGAAIAKARASEQLLGIAEVHCQWQWQHQEWQAEVPWQRGPWALPSAQTTFLGEVVAPEPQAEDHQGCQSPIKLLKVLCVSEAST